MVVWWWWCGVPGGRLNAGGSPVWPEDRRNRNGSSMSFSGLVAKRCAPYRLANGAAKLVSGDYFCLTRPPPELLRPGGLGWWSPQLQTARPLLEETLVQALPQDTPLPDLPLVGCWHEGFSGCPNWGVTVQALWLVLSVLALGPDGCRSPGCDAPAYTLTARPGDTTGRRWLFLGRRGAAFTTSGAGHWRGAGCTRRLLKFPSQVLKTGLGTTSAQARMIGGMFFETVGIHHWSTKMMCSRGLAHRPGLG